MPDVIHWLEAAQSSVQSAAAGGSFVGMLTSRTQFSWKASASLFLVGQVLAFFIALPLATWLMMKMTYYPALGLGIGLIGFYAMGGIVAFAQNFASDPWGTLLKVWGLWKGGGASPKGDGP